MRPRTSMKATSSMERNTEREFIITNQEENTRESGSMTRNMDMESSTTLMEIDMKALGKMESGLNMASMSTPMVMCMMVSGRTTSSKATESCKWLLVTNTKENGKAAKRTVQVTHSLI